MTIGFVGTNGEHDDVDIWLVLHTPAGKVIYIPTHVDDDPFLYEPSHMPEEHQKSYQ